MTEDPLRVQVEAFEVERGNVDTIVSNLGMKTFSFLAVPRRGDHVILHDDSIGPRTIYLVELVRLEGTSPDAPRVAQPSATIYVSELKTNRDLA